MGPALIFALYAAGERFLNLSDMPTTAPRPGNAAKVA